VKIFSVLIFAVISVSCSNAPSQPEPTKADGKAKAQQPAAKITPACTDNQTAVRFVDCGDGTVKDTDTPPLFWLKRPGCVYNHESGAKVLEMDFKAASIQVGEIKDGYGSEECNLRDKSPRGSWRLPTNAEWVSVLRKDCSVPPGKSPALAANKDAAGKEKCYADDPWADWTFEWATYWSREGPACSSSCIKLDEYVFFGQLQSGELGLGPITNHHRVWPVRDPLRQ